MIVTPREVDDMIDDAAEMIASGVNQALQSALSTSEIDGFKK